MSDAPPVILDASPEGVGMLLLNRPEKHNAFNAHVIERLSDAFETVKAAEHLRVLFIRGAGRSFSAGADLDWMKSAAHYSQRENEEDALALAEMLRKLYELPCLTVALIQGAAMGGGAGLAAACDVAAAVRSSVFRFSEVRLGLTPATISPYVIEKIGPGWTRALFATGEAFDAHKAERLGLVHHLVDDEAGLDAIAERLTDLIMETAPGAVANAKALVRDLTGAPIDHALARETARRIAAQRASDEGREGLAAYLEKRRPSWASDR